METVILELLASRKEFRRVLDFGFVEQGSPESFDYFLEIEMIDAQLQAILG